jgi:predicted RNA-binding protein YlxR (DUF448 family)
MASDPSRNLQDFAIRKSGVVNFRNEIVTADSYEKLKLLDFAAVQKRSIEIKKHYEAKKRCALVTIEKSVIMYY